MHDIHLNTGVGLLVRCCVCAMLCLCDAVFVRCCACAMLCLCDAVFITDNVSEVLVVYHCSNLFNAHKTL